MVGEGLNLDRVVREDAWGREGVGHAGVRGGQVQ